MSGGVAQLKDEGSQRQVAIAGAVAGLVSRFVIAPLDVIKIRLQLQIHSLSDPLNPPTGTTVPRPSPIRAGTLSTLTTILREEGITGLWKGNIPAEAMYLAYGSIQFSSYTYASHVLKSFTYPDGNGRQLVPDAVVSFVGGAMGGACATTATYPLDLLRTRFAAQGRERVYKSIIASVRQIYGQEGPTGFFRGLGAGVAQIVPYMGLFFASYESLKPLLADSAIPMPFGTSDALAGVVASVLSKTAVYPLDTTRKRLQVQGPMRGKFVTSTSSGRMIPVYSGVLRTLVQIWRHEGRRGLYRGLTVGLIKAAPASAVTMWTYERAMGVMLGWERGSGEK